MNLTIIQAIDKAYYKANAIGEDVDILSVINSYKILQCLNNEAKEALYNYIADRMGLSTKIQFNDTEVKILNKVIGYEYFK